MPLSPRWKKPKTPVLTPVGAGVLGGHIRGSGIEVKLEKPWGGMPEAYHGPGELVLDTDFTLIRVLNVDLIGIVCSAANYPSWDEVVGLAMMGPYAEDETLIGVNFQTHQGVCARRWDRLGNYQHLECGLDRHVHNRNPWVFERRQEAVKHWEQRVAQIAGTSGALLLEVLLGYEDDELAVLARKVLGTAQVIKDDCYY